MMKVKPILCGVLLTLVTGCASVNVRTDNMAESQKAPDYEQSFEFWWWGLEGEHSVNVREVCMGKGVKQMQAVTSFKDSVITLLTLGIYSKRTARVWCKD